MNKEINILIGTPAYGGMVHIDYLNSIIDMIRLGLPITVMSIGNESLITRGRNTIISYFYHLERFTHLFFLDADIKIKGEDVVRLMNHGKDVIGAKVPLKGFDTKGQPRYNIYGYYNKPNELVEAERLGNAVMILSRKAVEALIDGAETYYREPMFGFSEETKMFNVFKCGAEGGEYLSEDYWVCKRLMEKGFKIYVDLAITIGHAGTHRF